MICGYRTVDTGVNALVSAVDKGNLTRIRLT